VRREEILDAAVALFRSTGYHNATMAQIAQATGLAGSSLYRHFESKEAILLEALAQAGRHFIPYLETVSNDGDDPWAVVDELVDHLVEAVVLEPDLSTVLLRDRRSLPGVAQQTIADTLEHLEKRWIVALRGTAPVSEESAVVIVRGAMALVLSLTERAGPGLQTHAGVAMSMARASLRAGVLDALRQRPIPTAPLAPTPRRAHDDQT
jgi:AcrR family transcriptional regulator